MVKQKIVRKSSKNQMGMSDLKKGDRVILGISESSKYYHPFLKIFESEIFSATNNRITIMAPIANSSKQRWQLKRDDINFLQYKIQ